jgi:hypothetical protein
MLITNTNPYPVLVRLIRSGRVVQVEPEETIRIEEEYELYEKVQKTLPRPKKKQSQKNWEQLGYATKKHQPKS